MRGHVRRLPDLGHSRDQAAGTGTLYRSQSLDFHARAFAGDEVIATVRVLEKREDGDIRLETTIRRAGDDAPIVTGEAIVQRQPRSSIGMGSMCRG